WGAGSPRDRRIESARRPPQGGGHRPHRAASPASKVLLSLTTSDRGHVPVGVGQPCDLLCRDRPSALPLARLLAAGKAATFISSWWRSRPEDSLVAPITRCRSLRSRRRTVASCQQGIEVLRRILP